MSTKGIQTAINKANKISYKNLADYEKKYVKLRERIDQLVKFQGYLFSIAPRKENLVDWNKWETDDKKSFDLFCDTSDQIEKMTNSVENLIEKYQINESEVLRRHMQSQFSLSQSF